MTGAGALLWSLGRLAPAAPARALPLQPRAAREAPPRGLLKRHALSARGTPPEVPVPGKEKGGKTRGGGGAERELGAARRRFGALWASPSRVFVEPRIFLVGEFG